MGVQTHCPQSTHESPKSHRRKGTGTMWATVNARRSHVMLRDGGEESSFTSPVKQGSRAQQQGDPGPSPWRIITTHNRQEPGHRAPGTPEPPTQVHSALHQALEPSAFPPPVHRPQESHSPMAEGVLASGPPKHQPDLYTCHQAGHWGWLWYPHVHDAAPEQQSPTRTKCLLFCVINSSAESDHVAQPRQEQQ